MADGAMTVGEAVRSRRSVRAFLPDPVNGDLLRDAVAQAARSPSGGNLQPWHLYLLGGAELDRLKALTTERLAASPKGELMEYDIYPKDLAHPYEGRRAEVGEALYGHLGIDRGDRAARRAQFAANFRFFDAPVGGFLYVHRGMGPPQWADCGMFLQTLLLLLRERGLDSCAQEAWAMFPRTVGEFLGAPADLMLWTGLAIGRADPDAPANRLVAKRAAVEDFAEFRGV
ncbi:MAG: Nitroreductase [uncultured Sphingomonadaceae bacterium]|uniref:Nitroreductase n=1 Tax=uncultured Sphingomonadaceae bacterium TaxID=169976 RepID=A0A6J4SFW8_9SPHN|nr:MAG: Nitroreductase [uncultured Sphingomonadaceae bacterium]